MTIVLESGLSEFYLFLLDCLDLVLIDLRYEIKSSSFTPDFASSCLSSEELNFSSE